MTYAECLAARVCWRCRAPATAGAYCGGCAEKQRLASKRYYDTNVRPYQVRQRGPYHCSECGAGDHTRARCEKRKAAEVPRAA